MKTQPKPIYTDEFLRFWKLYPKQYHPGTNTWIRPAKAEAFEQWEHLDDEDKSHAMYSVMFYRRLKGQYIWHARRWLRNRGFDDWDMPEEKGEHLPESMTNVVKIVPEHHVNTNNERNRQRKELGL